MNYHCNSIIVCPPRSHSWLRFPLSSLSHARLLVRVLKGRLILPSPELALPARLGILHPHLDAVLSPECADEARIPELRGDAKVFATAHKRVRFGPFSRRSYAVWVKVFLLSTSSGYEAAHQEGEMQTVSWKERGILAGSSCALTDQDRRGPILWRQSFAQHSSRLAEPWPSLPVQRRGSGCDLR